MSAQSLNYEHSPRIKHRADKIFAKDEAKIHVRTDRLFGGLMLFQWLFGIGCALVVSPRAWEGVHAQVHLHVWVAVLLGAAIISFPLILVVMCPGRRMTRHIIAFSQMLVSALLIHLTGGRIETHFHVFGSLALLAFYKDWQVLITASAVVAIDHFARGMWWPQSVYGVLAVEPWRWLEHAGWVVYEDVFLIYSCIQSRRQLWEISFRQAALEAVNEDIEETIRIRTSELEHTHEALEVHRARSAESAKMAALGEMAAGIAHEINNPLAIIHGNAGQLKEMAEMGTPPTGDVTKMAKKIEATAMRISKIVKSLRSFAREAQDDPFQCVPVKTIIEDTIEFCRERFRSHTTDLIVDPIPESLRIECRSVQVSQVILNLLNNAKDATETLPEKWVRLSTQDLGNTVEIAVTDSGKGIPQEIRAKILQPFFTTKEVGKGTGLGLSVSKGIVESHRGKLILDYQSPNTRFLVRLPKTQEPAKKKEAA